MIAALVLMTLTVFGRVLGNDFVSFDDDLYVTSNARVQAGVTVQGTIWALTALDNYNWHPVTWYSHMADVQMFGMRPWGHHLTSLLLHVGNAVLLFLVLTSMTGAVWPSAFVAALFAVHPAHVESVAWIAERKDLLSAFFGFLALLAYAGYVKRPGPGAYLLLTLLFALGLMAKPMLVTLPFVLLLLDYWPLARLGEGARAPGNGLLPKRITLQRLVLEKVPLLALAAVSCVLTYVAQEQGGALSSLERLPTATRLANALVAYAGYLRMAIWPWPLAFFYPHRGQTLGLVEIAGSALVLAALSALAVRHAKRHPYLLVGWLWFLGTLVPVIGLVQVGLQSMADRYTYIPLVGLFIATAWGIAAAARSWCWGPRVLGSAAGVALSIFMAVSWVQAGRWRDSETLYVHALDVTEDNWLAHNNLGVVLYARGRIDEAVTHYHESIRLNPVNAQARINLGAALIGQGHMDEAIAEFREAARLKPDDPMPHFNLGVTLQQKGLRDEAIAEYRTALRIRPDMVSAHNNLGGSLFEQGNVEEAIVHFRAAVEAKPGDARAHVNLGIALASRHDLGAAIAQFQEALRIDPADPEARAQLSKASRPKNGR